MVKLYEYVGPEEIRRRWKSYPKGNRVTSALDLLAWTEEHDLKKNRDGTVTLTFVIDDEGDLRVASQRSEHVACAGGGPVRSAGEISLFIESGTVTVSEISNQSTGFCPEPDSYAAVAAALDRIGITHPGEFTRAIVFRRCPGCGQTNIVKDRWFFCGVCNTSLPEFYNYP